MKRLLKALLLLIAFFVLAIGTTNTMVDAGYCDELPEGTTPPTFCQ